MKYKLSEIMDLIGGGTPKTTKPEYWDGDIPWLSVKDFNNDFRFVYETEKHITELGLNNSSTKLLQAGDIIISARGTVGEIATIPFPMAFNQSCYGLRAKKEIVTADFLYYLIKHNIHVLKKNTHGSVFDTITRDTFAGIEVDIPDMDSQSKIAEILSNIDEKIEVNVRINENLQQQARAVFQAWFIDYEPFGGAAPLAWHPSTLGQIAELKTDSWSPAKNPDVMVEHYSIPAFDEQHYPVFEIAAGIKSNKYILNSNSVMISKLNPDTKRIWRPLCLSAHSVCSTEFIVYEAKKQEQRDYIYSILDSTPFLNHLCSHTTGSTNSRQRATPKSTLDFTLCLPPDSIIEDFCQIVTPMYDLIASNIVENQSLAKTRDSLLPRLVSGELDVSGIQL
jgi:type I restriction enzyme S subunit